MKLSYSKRFKKDLKKLHPKKVKNILSKILFLQNNPFIGKKLRGIHKGQLSLKIWPYRIIYKINKLKRQIIIITVEHRQGVYK